MLTFTRSGLVATPRALQIRVAAIGAAARANAPEPVRSLTDEELLANIRHFTEGRRGPRTRPVQALALSGVDRMAALPVVLPAARALGVSRITLHLSPHQAAELDDPRSDGGPDAVAIAVRAGDPIAPLARVPEWTAIVSLDRNSVADLPAFVAELAATARPTRLVFTWPFPPHGDPARPADAVEAMRLAIPALLAAGIPCGVKGLAACHLDGAPVEVWRSQNRYYVDATHQLDQALLFFPDVLRFARQDACRFCAREAECDGVPAEWLERGMAGALRPL
jgi:hypothetical protein